MDSQPVLSMLSSGILVSSTKVALECLVLCLLFLRLSIFNGCLTMRALPEMSLLISKPNLKLSCQPIWSPVLHSRRSPHSLSFVKIRNFQHYYVNSHIRPFSTKELALHRFINFPAFAADVKDSPPTSKRSIAKEDPSCNTVGILYKISTKRSVVEWIERLLLKW